LIGTVLIASLQFAAPLLQEGLSAGGLSASWGVALLVVSVAGYALVNTVEIAVVGASRIRTKHLAEQGRKSAQALERLRQRDDRFFAAIVLLQNLFVVIASTMAGFLAVEIAGGWGLIFGTIIATGGIAVFGEVTPKVLAAQAADPIALAVARPVELLAVVLRPVVVAVAAAPNVLSRLLFRGDARVTHTVTEAELRMLIDIAAKERAVGEEEAELMERVFRFYDRHVYEVMIPRTEITWLESGTTVAEFYGVYSERPHSRFPVYHETIDNVVGVVNIKDVLRGVAQARISSATPIDQLMRPPYFVPDTKLVGSLFVEMQERRQHMAIIVDEYGGTAGVVTLELLLEEMVGRVVDELGQPVEEFEAIDERTMRVDGGMSVDEAREELDLPLPEGDYETVAGYVLSVLGHIPKEGETVTGDGFSIRVAQVKGRKIEEVIVTRQPVSAPAAATKPQERAS
jgi:CBS domain containing-hemolysin-like protein